MDDFIIKTIDAVLAMNTIKFVREKVLKPLEISKSIDFPIESCKDKKGHNCYKIYESALKNTPNNDFIIIDESLFIGMLKVECKNLIVKKYNYPDQKVYYPECIKIEKRY